MSSSSDEEDIVMYCWYKRLQRRKQRKHWVHPYIARNMHSRLFVAARELQETDRKFVAFYRMSKESYNALVEIISPSIHEQNTNMRECVGAEERILITLRLAFYYFISQFNQSILITILILINLIYNSVKHALSSSSCIEQGGNGLFC